MAGIRREMEIAQCSAAARLHFTVQFPPTPSTVFIEWNYDDMGNEILGNSDQGN